MTRKIQPKPPFFQLKLAESKREVRAAQTLRYRVFSEEFGASGPSIDHIQEIDNDLYDPLADHLLLIDEAQTWNDGVIGTYRLLPQTRLADGQDFYSATEFDLQPLQDSGRRLLELGRSCVLATYRGTTTAVFELWSGLANYVLREQIDVLFGVASFPGTEPERLIQPLSLLQNSYLAPSDLRPIAHPQKTPTPPFLGPDKVDKREALMGIPPLIKAYLRVGGAVGQGYWVDYAFNTVDVCMVLDVSKIPPQQRALYAGTRVDGL